MKKNDIWQLALANAPFAQEDTPLDFLKSIDDSALYNLVKDEPPAVVASVLHCLGYKKSLPIMEKYQTKLQKEILRIMYLGNTASDSVLSIIAHALQRKIEKKG